jgi:hypothetical protein
MYRRHGRIVATLLTLPASYAARGEGEMTPWQQRLD